MKQEVIGVLGGMGSYATLDFFKRFINTFPAEKEWERPRIIIDNRCTIPSRVRAILYDENTQKMLDDMADSIRNLMLSGATKIVIACNTAHVFLEQLYELIPESKTVIINIIDECAKQISSKEIKTVVLLASEGTIQSQIYEKTFLKYGIQILSPTVEEYTQIRTLIEYVKTNTINQHSLDEFIDFVNKNRNCQAVVLGCTEFPILYEMTKCSLSQTDLQFFDPLESVLLKLKKIIN